MPYQGINQHPDNSTRDRNRREQLWLLLDSKACLRKAEDFENRALIQCSRQLGLSIRAIDVQDLALSASGKLALLHQDGAPVKLPAAVVNRTQSTSSYQGQAVLRQLEHLGVPCINSTESVSSAADKWRTAQVLATAGIPVPKTMLAPGNGNLQSVRSELGQIPLMIKVLSGSQGVGVLPVENSAFLSDLWELWHRSPGAAPMLIQQLIPTSYGKDLRVFVIGGVAVACMQRSAPAGGAKAGFSAGGTVQRYPLTSAVTSLALKTAKVLGLEIAGIDLLIGTSGYLVCEANSSPGWEGMQSCHRHLNIADLILKHVVKRAELLCPGELQSKHQPTLSNDYSTEAN